jgi:hypothetical protein
LQTIALATAVLLLVSAPQSRAAGGKEANSETALLAAAIAHAAAESRCRPKTPCCFGVDGRTPTEALAARLRKHPELEPIRPDAERGSDACWSLDASRVSEPTPGRKAVTIKLGPWGSDFPLTICTYFLRRSAGSWTVVPSETGCPVL